jgi:hypothetical protein
MSQISRENALRLIRVTIFEFHRDVMIPLNSNIHLYDRERNADAICLHERFHDFSTAVQDIYSTMSTAMEELEEWDNSKLSQFLNLCRDISELYDLPVHGEMPDGEVLEVVDEENDKLKEVRRLLEQDEVLGRKVLAGIENGLFILKAYDFFEYVDNNGSTKSANGFAFFDPDTIGFQIIERSAMEIAETIVHEYVHLTQKGKGMTLVDREIEASRESNKFIYRIRRGNISSGSSSRRRIDEAQARIIDDNVRRVVMREYGSYREGEYETILDNAYEDIQNPRIVRL